MDLIELMTSIVIVLTPVNGNCKKLQTQKLAQALATRTQPSSTTTNSTSSVATMATTATTSTSSPSVVTNGLKSAVTASGPNPATARAPP